MTVRVHILVNVEAKTPSRIELEDAIESRLATKANWIGSGTLLHHVSKQPCFDIQYHLSHISDVQAIFEVLDQFGIADVAEIRHHDRVLKADDLTQ